jgi:toxin secretion/phage lysis holin
MLQEFQALVIQLSYYTRQTLDFLWVKLGLALVYASLVPHGVALQGLLILCLVDLLLGTVNARRAHRLSSAGMRRGIAKLFIYFVFVATVALAEHIAFGTSGCTALAIGLLVVTELLSIIENLVLLGLPIPFASKFLMMFSNKIKHFGLNISPNEGDNYAVMRDLLQIIERRVPNLQDPVLHNAVRVYVGFWYTWVDALNVAMFNGSPELAYQRLRASTEQNLLEIKSAMARDGVDDQHQQVFLNVWNRKLLSWFRARVKLACDAPIENEVKLERVRDALTLMIFRMMSEAEMLDKSGPDPICTNAWLEFTPDRNAEPMQSV